MTTSTDHGVTPDYRPDWRDHAACRDADTEAFYPDVGSRSNDRYRRHAQEALAICSGCPVAADCLAWALDRETATARWGIWGGLTPQERAELSNLPRCEWCHERRTPSKWAHYCSDECRRAGRLGKKQKWEQQNGWRS